MKFVVRFLGTTAGEGLREKLVRSPRIKVLEQTPRMMLVDAEDEQSVRTLVGSSSKVLIAQETSYDPPGQPFGSVEKRRVS